MGIRPNTVRKLLVTELGFSRESNQRADEGANHPDRNASSNRPRVPAQIDATDLRRSFQARESADVRAAPF